MMAAEANSSKQTLILEEWRRYVLKGNKDWVQEAATPLKAKKLTSYEQGGGSWLPYIYIMS